MAGTIAEETRTHDFAPSELPKAIEYAAEGTGVAHDVLRKRVLDAGGFRYVPFAPDKPIVGELTGAGIYRFWDRLILGEVAQGEKVCLYNPAGGPVLSNCNVRLVRA